MSNYTKTTNFTAKDSLPAGNAAKIILGATHDVEFDAIAVSIATKADTTTVTANATAAAIGAALFPRSAAEVTAGAVPNSYNYSEFGEENFSRFLSTAKIAAAYLGTTPPNIDVELQLAINTYKAKRIPLIMGPYTYLVTQKILTYPGTIIRGCTVNKQTASYGVPGGTTINFTPTVANTDLFSFQSGAAFVAHVSISGLYLNSTNSNGRYGIDCDWVINGNFYNLVFNNFVSSIRCYHTLSCRFENCYLQGTSYANYYAGGSATTDVWSKCMFFSSPVGNRHVGSNISIRYTNCLYEQLDTYGVQNDRECQSIIYTDCYCEDVPFTNTATGAMFKIGYDGTTLLVENALIVTGGVYQGRNAGTVGSFIDADYCNGIIAGGFNVSRFTNVIKATTNTRARSIALTPFKGISNTNVSADATTTGKMTGVYANANLDNVSAGMTGQFSSVDVTNSVVAGGDVYAGFVLGLTDGITAPATIAGKAQIYVDVADGDLKIKYGDGVIKTIVIDT